VEEGALRVTGRAARKDDVRRAAFTKDADESAEDTGGTRGSSDERFRLSNDVLEEIAELSARHRRSADGRLEHFESKDRDRNLQCLEHATTSLSVSPGGTAPAAQQCARPSD
jgi:hypothetical protein